MPEISNLERAKNEIISTANNPDNAKKLFDLLDKAHKAEIRQYQSQVENLEKKLEIYENPPLQHGIIIGPSPDHSNHFIAGIQGVRYEVKIDEKAGLKPGDLFEGQEVLFNRDYNIVRIRTFEYPRGESGEILDVLNGGKNLHIKSGDEGIVVETSRKLYKDVQEKRVGIGDRVRWDSKLGIAFEKIAVSEVKELLMDEPPDVTYEMIGGLDEAIGIIRDAIELPYLYKKLFEEHHLKRPKGILLFGPPGCGKTMIAKAIANSLSKNIHSHLKAVREALALSRELDTKTNTVNPAIQSKFKNIWSYLSYQKPSAAAVDLTDMDSRQMAARLEEFLGNNKINRKDAGEEIKRLDIMIAEAKSYFFNIKGPELLNKYVGETESSIRKAFAQARKKASFNTPVILFFDEIESMFRTRGIGISSDMESTIVPQLLSELDGVEILENIIIIGASNRPELIDPAILRPGRLDVKIKIERPEQNAARKIFAIYLTSDVPIHKNELKKYGNDKQKAIDRLIEKAVGVIYDDKSYLQVVAMSNKKPALDDQQTLYFRDFISGAMIESIVSRAKKRAVKRVIGMLESGEAIEPAKGLTWKDDLLPAILDEYEENKEQFIAQKTHDFQINFAASENIEIKVILSEEATEAEIEKKHPY